MKWINRFDWRLPWNASETFPLVCMLLLWAIAGSFSVITGVWWASIPALVVVTVINVGVLCADTGASILKPWSMLVGTTVTSRTPVVRPHYDGDKLDDSRAVEVLETFSPRNYYVVNNYKVVFRTKRDATLFKLSCGGRAA